MRACSVSVDLDPLECYYRIHGLGDPPEALRNVILRRAFPRFQEILARRKVLATFFVVGRDLEDAAARNLLGNAAEAGHELGNHSYSHPYEMARLSTEEIDREVGRAERLLQQVG